MTTKVVFFDFMGTCLDWHTSIMTVLPPALSEDVRSRFALQWRNNFFNRINERYANGEGLEAIDISFYYSFVATLAEYDDTHFAPLLLDPTLNGIKDLRTIKAWHSMPAWPDVLPALERLHGAGLELFVLANGTTRLQLDLVRAAGLQGMFHMLFSSQLLGVYKPSPEAYQKALELVGCEAHEAVMVACHAYDLDAAKKVGMKAVYVRRWTDDINEDMDALRAQYQDAFLEEGFTKLLETIQNL